MYFSDLINKSLHKTSDESITQIGIEIKSGIGIGIEITSGIGIGIEITSGIGIGIEITSGIRIRIGIQIEVRNRNRNRILESIHHYIKHMELIICLESNIIFERIYGKLWNTAFIKKTRSKVSIQ